MVNRSTFTLVTARIASSRRLVRAYSAVVLTAAGCAVAAPADPQRGPSAYEPISFSDVSVEEAVRLAADDIDRLDALRASESEGAQALLERIRQVVEFVEKEEPDHASLDYLRGRLYAFIGRESEAMEHLQRFVGTRAGRNEWRAYRVLGDLFVEHYPRLARSHYESAAHLKSFEPTILAGLSRCARGTGDLNEAIRFAKDAAEADGDKTVFYAHNLARMLMADNNWTEAQGAAEMALNIAKRSAGQSQNPREWLGVVESQYNLLIAILRRRVNETPGAAQPYLDLVNYLRQRSQNSVAAAREDALSVLKRGIENTAPSTPAPLLEQYAIALSEAGRSEDASKAFQDLRDRYPDNPAAAAWIGRAQSDEAATDDQHKP